jgi:hypothetical protein
VCDIICRKELQDRLDLKSITSGVGVDTNMMETCLNQLLAYLDKIHPDPNSLNSSQPDSQTDSHDCYILWNSLKQVLEFDIKIGRYLGIADDGAFIIPWDIDLRSHRENDMDTDDESNHETTDTTDHTGTSSDTEADDESNPAQDASKPDEKY